MNASFSFAIALVTMVIAPSSRSVGADLLDFPGPGYRQQLESFSAKPTASSPALLRIETEFIHPQFLDRERPFLSPIRLFDSTTANPTVIKAGSGTFVPKISPTPRSQAPKPVTTK